MDYSIFDGRYYLDGKANGLSLYEDYRWLPNLTMPFTKRIAEFCHIHPDDTICDFGCARGYVVKAFRRHGFRAEGIDASAWAIWNCDPEVREYVKEATRIDKDFDWILAKDVLEHVPPDDLPGTIDNIMKHARKGVFVVVPLSPETGAPYVVPDYEKDVTHVNRFTLADWQGLLQRHGWCVGACYRVRGVKDNYFREGWEEGNGFLVATPEEPGQE